MDTLSTAELIIFLVILLLLSAYFSSSETAMMSLNRYRLKHLAKQNHKGAKRSASLLERPDKLIGLILIGNNLVNILASAIATIIGIRLYGDLGVAIATGALTFLMLVFSEVTPKTLAAAYPEKVAFPSSRLLKPLMWLMTPFVITLNMITNGILRLCGVKQTGDTDELSPEELRTVVHEAGGLIPKRHREMLLSILDLEKVTVEDVMVPRSDIYSVNINDDFDKITYSLIHSPHTRIVLYRDNIDDTIGILHLRDALSLLAKQRFTKENILKSVKEAYYIPEGTPLNVQLLKFQNNHAHSGLVVDEYGDIQGLVSLEDILEEIVGDFTPNIARQTNDDDIKKVADGSFIVNASLTIRELNRKLQLNLDLDGPKTLNGLIIEQLEDIPEQDTDINIDGYAMRVLETNDLMITSVQIHIK